MISAHLSDSDHPAAHRLCPTCGSPTIRITTTMLVHFDVIFESNTHEFSVIDEMLGDAMWDDGTEASCQVCRWQGTVGDLRRKG